MTTARVLSRTELRRLQTRCADIAIGRGDTELRLEDHPLVGQLIALCTDDYKSVRHFVEGACWRLEGENPQKQKLTPRFMQPKIYSGPRISMPASLAEDLLNGAIGALAIFAVFALFAYVGCAKEAVHAIVH